MSACGKPPNTDAFSTAPLASAAIAMSMMSFMGWRDGVCTSVLVIIGREPHTMTGATSPSSARTSVRAGALGRLAHVDVRDTCSSPAMTVAFSTMRAVMCAWKSSPTAIGSVGATARIRRRSSPSPSSTCSATIAPCSARNAASQPFRMAPTMASHMSSYARLLDVARGMRARRDGDDDLGAHLLRPRGGTRRAGCWCR